MKKILTGLASLTLAVGSIEAANAAVVVLDSTAGPLSIYDQGGVLNSPPGLNCSPASLPNIPTGTPFYMGGLEVAPDGSGVYVTQFNNLPCNDWDHATTLNRLVKSTGLGTASPVGPNLAAGNRAGPFGNDLTYGPDGRYYIGTTTGIWGFDPAGGVATRYASWNSDFASTGLTFSADGNTALVSSDIPTGIFSIPRNSNITNLQSLITVIPEEPWDDHVISKDGKILMVGDNASAIFEVLPNGSLTEIFGFDQFPAVRAAFTGSSFGSRGAVDPITGDIFYAVSFDTVSSPIVRIKSDFSSASLFATGFAEDLRDIDFGPSSSGLTGAISLYVSENNRATGVGTIYEISVGTTAVPEPSDTILCSIIVLGFGALFKRELTKKQK